MGQQIRGRLGKKVQQDHTLKQFKRRKWGEERRHLSGGGKEKLSTKDNVDNGRKKKSRQKAERQKEGEVDKTQGHKKHHIEKTTLKSRNRQLLALEKEDKRAQKKQKERAKSERGTGWTG